MGEGVYADECATCHSASGQGSSLYPALNGSEFLTADDPSQAIQLVLQGRGEMPSFSDVLSNRQIAAVLSYERTSWSNEAAPVTEAEVEAVRQSGAAGD